MDISSPDFLHHVFETYGYWGLSFILVVDNMNIPFPPTEVVLPAAGWAIAKGLFNPIITYIISVVSSVIGCFFFYMAFRFGGDKFMPLVKKVFRINDEKIKKASAFFHKYGGFGVFLGRLVPGLRTISLIPAGIFSYSIPKFLIWVTLGTIIWNGVLMFFGHAIFHFTT